MVIATSASIEVVSRESFARRLEGMRNERSSTSPASSLLSPPSSTVACVNCHKQRGDGQSGPKTGSSAGGCGGNGNNPGKRKSLGRQKPKNSHTCNKVFGANTCSSIGGGGGNNNRHRKKSQNAKNACTGTKSGIITSSSPIVINIRDSLLRSRKHQMSANKFRQSSLDADSDASSSRSTDEDIWANSCTAKEDAISTSASKTTPAAVNATPSDRANRRGSGNNNTRRRDEDEHFLDETSSTSVSEELSSSPDVVSYLQDHDIHHHNRNRVRSSRSDRYRKYTRGSHNNSSNRSTTTTNNNNNRGLLPLSKSHHYYGGLYHSFYNQGGESTFSLSPSVSSPSSRKHWTAIISEIEKSHAKDRAKGTDVNLADYYSNLLNNYDHCHRCDTTKTDEGLNNSSYSSINHSCKDVEVKKRNVAESDNVDLICNDLYTSNEKLSEESTDESDSSDKASVLSSSDVYSDDSAGGGSGPPSIAYNNSNAKKFGRKFSADQLDDLAEYTAGVPIVQYDSHPTQCDTCMSAITSYPYYYSYYDAYETNQASRFLYDLHALHQTHHHNPHHQYHLHHHHHHHPHRFYPNRHRQYFYNHHRMPYLYNSHHHFPSHPNHHHLRQYRYLYPLQLHNHWIIERPSSTRDKLSPSYQTTTQGRVTYYPIDHGDDNDILQDGHTNIITKVKAYASSPCSSPALSSSSSLLSPPASPPLPPSPPAMITTSSNTVVKICSKSSGKFFSSSTSSSASSSSSLLSKQGSSLDSVEDEEQEAEEEGLEKDNQTVKTVDVSLTLNQIDNQKIAGQSKSGENVEADVNNKGRQSPSSPLAGKTTQSNQKESQDQIPSNTTTTDTASKTTKKDWLQRLHQQTTIATSVDYDNDHRHASSSSSSSSSSSPPPPSSSSSPSEEVLHKDCNLNNSVFMDLTDMDVSFTVHYPGDPAHLCLTSGSNGSSGSSCNKQISGNLLPYSSPSVSYNYSHGHDFKNNKKNNNIFSSPLISPSPLSVYSCLSSPHTQYQRSTKKDLYNKLFSNKNRVPLGQTSSAWSSSSSVDDVDTDPQSYELAMPANRPWISTGQPDQDVPAAVFTVMCYNVLSDKLCTKQMYGYCPTWALAWDYRKKGIMSDIIGGNADIITLQEVETEQYYGLFMPELVKRGYDGVFLPKSRVRTMNSDKEKMSVDGCAIFYKKTKFEKVNEHHVEFSQLATKDGASNTDSDMINRVSTKDNIAIVAMLRTKPAAYDGSPVPAPKGLSQMLMVSTAHIHWDPQLPDVKLVQTIMLVEELRKFIKEASVQFRPNAPPPSVDSADMCSSLPLILCGDFNSLPDSGVFEFLSKGKLNTRHRDFDGQNYKAFMKDRNENGILNHNFKLTSAYKDVIPFTNYTFDFKGVIDYIFYSGQHIKLHGVMGLQDEEWFRANKIVGCPHPFVPSDHFPLFAEFSLPAKPSPKPSGTTPR